MLSIYDAATMICEIRAHAEKVGVRPYDLVIDTPQGRKLNEILEKADRLDEIDFPGTESAWYQDIFGNRHRIRVASFGWFYVESESAESYKCGAGVIAQSCPLRNQGAAVSVLARKLMVSRA